MPIILITPVLPITYYLLPFTAYLLPITYYVLPTYNQFDASIMHVIYYISGVYILFSLYQYCQLPIACCRLPVYSLLLTTYCLQPF